MVWILRSLMTRTWIRISIPFSSRRGMQMRSPGYWRNMLQSRLREKGIGKEVCGFWRTYTADDQRVYWQDHSTRIQWNSRFRQKAEDRDLFQLHRTVYPTDPRRGDTGGSWEAGSHPSREVPGSVPKRERLRLSDITPIEKRGLKNSGMLQNPELPRRKRSMRSLAGMKRKSGNVARHTSKSVIAGSRRNMLTPRHLQSREIRRLLNFWQSMIGEKHIRTSRKARKIRQNEEQRKKHL